MIRSTKLSLKFATKRKLRQLNELLIIYRQAVNYWISVQWFQSIISSKEACKLSKEYKKCGTRLPAKYISAAFRQAKGMVDSVKILNGSMPQFNGSMTVLSQIAGFKNETNEFDFFLAIASCKSHHKIHIPLKKTKHFNKLMSLPGAKLKGGCTIGNKFVTLWVNIPDFPTKTEGETIGVDIGVNKLLVDSNEQQYGTDFKRIRDKILRRKLGSRNRRQACIERDHLINRCVNQLPWDKIKAIGVEDLTGLKVGKKRGQTKQFRRKMAPWSYRQVINRIVLKAQENRVCPVFVNPANTSRRCPKCGNVSKDNKLGECFCCVSCGYTADADFVGATNVLVKTTETLGSLKSPELQKIE